MGCGASKVGAIRGSSFPSKKKSGGAEDQTATNGCTVAAALKEVFQIATQEGHSELLRAFEGQSDDLITAGNVLKAAACEGLTDILQILLPPLNATQIDSRDSKGRTALLIAAKEGHLEATDTLVRAGADPNVRQLTDQFSPLMFAAQNGHLEVVDLLLRCGADVRALLPNKVDTLMFACQNGHVQVADLLIQSGADPLLQAEDGWNSLMISCQRGHLEVVDLLLRAGADVRARNKEGCDALMVAAMDGHLETVCLLTRPTITDNCSALGDESKRAAAAVASERGHSDIAELILQSLQEKEEGDADRGQGDSGGDGLRSFVLPPESTDWAGQQRESWGPMAELLTSGAIALWPLEIFQVLLKEGEMVPRRQNVEPTLRRLGWSEERVQKVARRSREIGEGGEFPFRGRFAVVCLSYGWLSADHPDPFLFHLQKLVEEMDTHYWSRGEMADQVFVFWDYLSLFQKPRTAGQEEMFKKALTSLDLLYSSHHTFVFRSTGVPLNSPNPLHYSKRGWPTFETFVTGFKPPRLVLQVRDVGGGGSDNDKRSKLSVGTRQREGGGGLVSASAPVFPSHSFKSEAIEPDSMPRLSEAWFGRRKTVSQNKQEVLVPSAPSRFNKVLSTKTFTNGSDREVVQGLYRHFVSKTATKILDISFASRATFGDAEADTLSDLLAFIREGGMEGEVEESGGGEEPSSEKQMRASIRSVDLSRTRVSDAGAARLVEELGRLDNLRQLILRDTSVGCLTVRALKQSMEGGGLKELNHVSFQLCANVNGECVKELCAFVAALCKRKKKGLLLGLTETKLDAEAICRVKEAGPAGSLVLHTHG